MSKIFKRNKKDKASASAEQAKQSANGRITNATIEHYRQEILSKASQYKTPIEASRAVLVRRTILIASLAIIIFIGIFLFGVYKRGNTSEFVYNVSKVIPLPIATIEQENVLLDDYLAPYLASKHYTENSNFAQHHNTDADRVYRQQSINTAIDAAYARKIVRQNQIEVTDEMVDQYFQRTAIGFYNADQLLANKASQVIETDFGMSVDDYRNILIKNALMVRLASISVDDDAKKLAEEIDSQIKKDGSNFDQVIKKYEQDQRVVITSYSEVPHTNNDSGRSVQALKLQPKQVSDFFNEERGGDYTIVQLISKDDKKLSFKSITVLLTKFRQTVEKLKQDQLHFYIDTSGIYEEQDNQPQ